MSALALHAEKLSVQLGKTPVLQGITASFAAGRWSCIVGPNGAGKSTLLKALAGLLPSQGSIGMFGQPVHEMPLPKRAQQLAWLGQDELGALQLRVGDVVMLGRLPHLGLLASATHKDAVACEEAMAQTEVTHLRHALLAELSAGQQQRVRLARALATQAKLLLLDEPLANLDPPHQLGCVSLMKSLAKSGVAVISVLHELPMALHSDELLILQTGRVVHQGASSSDATHRAIEQVFDHKIRVISAQGHWLTIPA